MTEPARERAVRVVVIDDAIDIRELMRIALSRGGMDVVGEAADGRAGIEVVREQLPDVVLLDLSMPVMDGLESLPYIRELVPDARIIVFTGFGEGLSEQLLQSGADGHLSKGTSLKDILAYIQEQLGD